MYILGISCYYHDSAACLIHDEEVVAAAEEERFSRSKHDSSFPGSAVEYCLDEAGIEIDDVEYVGFYEKPVEKFDRLLETFLSVAPFGYRSLMQGMPVWLRKRLWLRGELKSELGYDGEILFGGHHESHAASSFYASPFDDAAIITVDGVGEWNTTTLGFGRGNDVEIYQTIDFPHSIGLLYSAFTSYLGFQVNNGEYKVMGLASYGDPTYEGVIKDNLIDIKADSSFRLNMDYFSYLRKLEMVNSDFEELFGHPSREPDSDVEDHHFDIAASIQSVTEDLLLGLAKDLYADTDSDYLCLGGGVALNSVANGRLLEETSFEDIFIQPAAGDDGGAYGVASSIYYRGLGNDRTVPDNRRERMKGTYLGPEYDSGAIETAIGNADVNTVRFDTTEELLSSTASRLAEENVVGLYQGRMEWGPRALGNRSILGDPRNGEMQDIVNMKIKFREGFRPFAPTVLADRATEYFDAPRESPYMLFVFDVHDDKKDEIPAVTHADGTSRIQTIRRDDNEIYYDLIKEFDQRSGVPVVLNTSLNRRGEPIVNTPEDAIDCFAETDMDYMCFPEVNTLIGNPADSSPVNL